MCRRPKLNVVKLYLIPLKGKQVIECGKTLKLCVESRIAFGITLPRDGSGFYLDTDDTLSKNAAFLIDPIYAVFASSVDPGKPTNFALSFIFAKKSLST
jgi:hypothetical protein